MSEDRTPEDISRMFGVTGDYVDQIKREHGDPELGKAVREVNQYVQFDGSEYRIVIPKGSPGPSEESLAELRGKMQEAGFSEDELIKLGFPEDTRDKDQ